MFTRKKEIEELKRKIATLAHEVSKIPEKVECEKCGCLLKKSTAIKGKSTVEKESWLDWLFRAQREVIKEHYFCKVHAPKGKK